MQTYHITITNDMQQQVCISANSVTEALEQAKKAFKESDITGTPEGKLKSHSLQNSLKYVIPKVVVNPPVIKKTKEDREKEEQERLSKIPK